MQNEDFILKDGKTVKQKMETFEQSLK